MLKICWSELPWVIILQPRSFDRMSPGTGIPWTCRDDYYIGTIAIPEYEILCWTEYDSSLSYHSNINSFLSVLPFFVARHIRSFGHSTMSARKKSSSSTMFCWRSAETVSAQDNLFLWSQCCSIPLMWKITTEQGFEEPLGTSTPSQWNCPQIANCPALLILIDYNSILTATSTSSVLLILRLLHSRFCQSTVCNGGTKISLPKAWHW